MPTKSDSPKPSKRSKTPKTTAAGRSLVRGIEEATAYLRGDLALEAQLVPPVVDVKKLRAKLRLSQTEFAARFRFSTRAVQDWEQGRATPESAVRAYLTVIDRDPTAVERALGE